jgi:hypothetical protein
MDDFSRLDPEREPVRSRDFQGGPGEKLTAAEPYLNKCRWQGQAVFAGRPALLFWCEYFKVDSQGVLHLESVIFDNSERANGVMLRQRLTWNYKSCLVGCSVLFIPFERHELAGAPEAGSSAEPK